MCSNTSVFPRLYVNHVSRRTPYSHAVFAGSRPSARLTAEVSKLQALVSCQSISNFVVNLPNVRKRCEGATVPAVAALTLPRPAQGREKENSFPPLCIPPFLLMVLASRRIKRVLQAREIRRIGFSLTYSYPLRVSTEMRIASAQATESKAERTALLCEV